MKHLWLTPFVLFAPACLENEEELEIHPDGSVEVTLSSRGDLADLADGYPIPLDDNWTLASEDAVRWVRTIGTETGSPKTRQRAKDVAWPGDPGEEPQGKLIVKRRFDSVEEMPQLFAAVDDPYRSAHLLRDTSLEVDERPGGRLFRFERVYRGFDHARFDPIGQLDIPKELAHKFEDQEALTDAERERITGLLIDGFRRVSTAFARDALLGMFTDVELTEGGLAARELEDVLAEVQRAQDAVVTPERLDRLLELAMLDGDATGEEIERIEEEWREIMRKSLGTALEKRGVADAARNAALFALEWLFAAYDLTGDVGDETFVLKVRLPGTIVGGNFTSLTDGVARWEFQGSDLGARDITLSAVSVLE